jgi:hypothetical protein
MGINCGTFCEGPPDSGYVGGAYADGVFIRAGYADGVYTGGAYACCGYTGNGIWVDGD